jgi:UDP-N-acetylglucosamine 1-carboxyvinyltransferase
VQDLCHFLVACGVKIDGIGTTTLTVRGMRRLNKKVTYTVSEDPTDAMFFIAAAVVTRSKLLIKRCPIEFLELELLTLEKMNLKFKIARRYLGANKKVQLADIQILPSDLIAPPEKVAARPYPGLNIDNLPFFAVIATQAEGETLIHDWVYEKRAIYYTELEKLGAEVTLADPHRVYIKGKTPLRAAELVCPPALRPATILFIGMLAAKGRSVLRNVYSISRGYEDLIMKLRGLGAAVDQLDE